MRTIWKYELEIADEAQKFRMPEGARLIFEATQQGSPCLWAEVDPEAPLVERWFVVHGTGHDIDHDGDYVGSGLALGGQFVWHVYEVTP